MKFSNQEFIDLVEERTWDVLDKKPGTPGRQSIATTRGQQVEHAAKTLLLLHPNVERVEGQVFDDRVDEFSNIDLVVYTKDGRTVYVPCARDLWLGTSQQDRLQIVWAKNKTGLFEKFDVCYLVLDDVNDILQKVFTKRARRGVKIKECCVTLFNKGVLMNFSHLWEHLL